jgi:acetate kinase
VNMAAEAGRVLVVNAGSSSLKLRVLTADDEVAGSADLPAPRGTADSSAIKAAIEPMRPVHAVGHRIVHGGTLYTEPVLLTDEVRQRLESFTDLAPLHQPKSLAALDAVQAVLPGTPGVACFDTAFHATIGAAAATFALPVEWRTRWTLRRYGFHGLSHAYASRRAAQLTGVATRDGLRVVTCHLGAGASLAAVHSGRSVDTTMGFTPLDGLVMATRSGSVDPGLVLWLEEHVHTPPAELAATLEYRSGLLGLAGTDDMREVLARAAAGDQRAVLGRDVYLHRLRASIAAMAAAMDGLDVLVFTGGVGEHAAEIRSRAAAGLGFLGVRLDEARNSGGTGDDWEIGADGAPVRAFVIAAREDKQIAAEVRAVLGLRTHVGRHREGEQPRLPRLRRSPVAVQAEHRDRRGGEGRRRRLRRSRQPGRELGQGGVVPDKQHRAQLVGELADEHQQSEHRGLVHPRLVPDRGRRARHRLRQAGGRQLPGLPRAACRRAHHRVRHVPGPAQPAAHRRAVPLAALGERTLVVGDVGPVRLGVPEQE